MTCLTVGPPPAHAPAHWPAEVDLIISALVAGEARLAGSVMRRAVPRMSYRAPAALQLFCDPRCADPWRLYIRDASPRGLGFITCCRVPLGNAGVVELVGPDGEDLAVPCALLRCREIATGWFDGALRFDREQPIFTMG